MRRVPLAALAAAIVALASHADDAASPRTWSFEADKLDAPPAGFHFGRTGSGALGHWVVRAEKGAPSGSNILAQTDTDDTDNRFPLAVADAPSLRELRLSVKCKPISGKVDQVCGLVFRYRDENNYYLTRAGALENNVRLYFVKDGRRKEFASWSGRYRAAPGTSLRGKVGVWTKADSVTLFDDLTVAGL